MDPKIDTFGQVGIRDLAILGGQKSRFLDVFEVVLELFRNRLGIVFDLKRPTFDLFSVLLWSMTPLNFSL